jgi:hypothetical protein
MRQAQQRNGAAAEKETLLNQRGLSRQCRWHPLQVSRPCPALTENPRHRRWPESPGSLTELPQRAIDGDRSALPPFNFHPQASGIAG